MSKQQLRREYEHAGEALDRNRKKTVKLLRKLKRLQQDHAAWLRESERTTQALYKLEFPDDE